MVTWLQLLRKQANTGNSTALIAETHRPTRIRLRAHSRNVTPTCARSRRHCEISTVITMWTLEGWRVMSAGSCYIFYQAYVHRCSRWCHPCLSHEYFITHVKCQSCDGTLSLKPPRMTVCLHGTWDEAFRNLTISHAWNNESEPNLHIAPVFVYRNLWRYVETVGWRVAVYPALIVYLCLGGSRFRVSVTLHVFPQHLQSNSVKRSPSLCNLGLRLPWSERKVYLNLQTYTKCDLTLILLTWRIWWASNNASRWQMRFNPVFKGLRGES